VRICPRLSPPEQVRHFAKAGETGKMIGQGNKQKLTNLQHKIEEVRHLNRTAGQYTVHTTTLYHEESLFELLCRHLEMVLFTWRY
jgi:hypothetical protein